MRFNIFKLILTGNYGKYALNYLLPNREVYNDV